MESTYLYSVHPKKIIKGLLEQPIRTARSLYLTKEQVKERVVNETISAEEYEYITGEAYE